MSPTVEKPLLRHLLIDIVKLLEAQVVNPLAKFNEHFIGAGNGRHKILATYLVDMKLTSNCLQHRTFEASRRFVNESCMELCHFADRPSLPLDYHPSFKHRSIPTSHIQS